MTIAIPDATGRTFELEADNDLLPGSVFLAGPSGLCIEFDRSTLMSALRAELGEQVVTDTGTATEERDLLATADWGVLHNWQS